MSKLDKILKYESELYVEDILDSMQLGNYDDNSYKSNYNNYNSFRDSWNEYVNGWN